MPVDGRNRALVEIRTVSDRDDGFVRCVITEDPANEAAILTPPTFIVIDPGTSRASDPQSDPVVGGPLGTAVVVQVPYTRRDAVTEITFTNTYPAAEAPPIEIAPAFAG